MFTMRTVSADWKYCPLTKVEWCWLADSVSHSGGHRRAGRVGDPARSPSSELGVSATSEAGAGGVRLPAGQSAGDRRAAAKLRRWIIVTRAWLERRTVIMRETTRQERERN